MDVQRDGRKRRERRREGPEDDDQRPADEQVAEETVEFAEFVVVEYRALVEKDRTGVFQTVANRARVARVVPGDQKVVEVDADADDGSEGDPAQPGEQVQPGVEPGGQADGDGDDEVVSRVDRNSLGRRFAQATLMRFSSSVEPPQVRWPPATVIARTVRPRVAASKSF